MAFGLAFAVVVGGGTYWDFRQSADGPRETATVVARQEAGRGYCPTGVRSSSGPKWNVTWRSKNSPAGLPATFVEENVCSSNTVGDTVEIIRVIEDGRTKVYQDVVHAGRESLELAAAAFVILTPFALPLTWLRAARYRCRRGRDAGR